MSVSAGASGRATASLVVGILGFMCCQLCAPVAWFLGAQERDAIRTGRASPNGQGIATAGMILGIVGTVIFVAGVCMALLWALFFGGIAVLGGALS
ncbi:MAG: DUF4190 domain-containing protein [Vicinamibacteria bacterium]|nr:DUF4190 domain-containing protein [Vicinamibacteria bacterium]